MQSFLLTWLITATALGLAVLALSVVYRLLDSDFGTEGWLRESGIVLVTAAIQAGAIVLLLGLDENRTGHSFRAIHLLAFAATYVIYKVTHSREMTELELGVLVATNVATFLFLWIALYRQLAI